LWADIELGLAILAASAAALRPLLRHIPALLDGTSKQGSGTGDSGPYHELEVNSRDTSNMKKGSDHTTMVRPTTNETTVEAASSDEELFRVR
jgi:hypothetical protein